MARRRTWNPIKIVRRRLQRIERQSATRSRTPWARAIDWCLLLSLPLGCGLAFVLDANVSRVSTETLATVRLGRDDRGTPLRGVIVREDPVRVPWPFGSPLATVEIRRRTIEHGWPFASRTTLAPLELPTVPLADPDVVVDLAGPDASIGLSALRDATNVDLFDGLDVSMDVMISERRPDLVDDVRSRTTSTTRSWSATLAAAATLWLLLFVSSIVLIRTIQFGTWGVRRVRRRRMVGKLRDGRCPFCGYDLSGVRFPKKCSECGRRIWG